MKVTEAIDIETSVFELKEIINNVPDWAIIEKDYSSCYYEGDSPEMVIEYIVTDDTKKVLEHNDIVYFKVHQKSLQKGVVKINKDKIWIKTDTQNYNSFYCDFIYQHEENHNLQDWELKLLRNNETIAK